MWQLLIFVLLSNFFFTLITFCLCCSKKLLWIGAMQVAHFSLPWRSKVEACSQILVPSRQTEMTAWFMRSVGFLPQIRNSSLTAGQPSMRQIWRWLWNTKNLWGTIPVLHTIHMNTWKLGVTVVMFWATQAGPPWEQRGSWHSTWGIKDRVQSFLTIWVKN